MFQQHYLNLFSYKYIDYVFNALDNSISKLKNFDFQITINEKNWKTTEFQNKTTITKDSTISFRRYCEFFEKNNVIRFFRLANEKQKLKRHHQKFHVLMNNQIRFRLLLNNEFNCSRFRLQRRLQLRQWHVMINCLIVRLLKRRDFSLSNHFNEKLNRQFNQLIVNVKHEIINWFENTMKKKSNNRIIDFVDANKIYVDVFMIMIDIIVVKNAWFANTDIKKFIN